MKRIWKIPLKCDSKKDGVYPIDIEVPKGAKLLNAGSQPTGTIGSEINLWFECDETAPKVPYRLLCIGTGHGAVPDEAIYFTSLICNNAVWHLYVPYNQPLPWSETRVTICFTPVIAVRTE